MTDEEFGEGTLTLQDFLFLLNCSDRGDLEEPIFLPRFESRVIEEGPFDPEAEAIEGPGITFEMINEVINQAYEGEDPELPDCAFPGFGEPT